MEPKNNESETRKSNKLFQALSDLSKKQTWNSVFDYLKSIATELGEDRSFYTTDFGDVLWKYQQWTRQLPRVQMFYAVKANPDPMILRFLVIVGASFDCATEGEIRAVLQAGAGPERIIFANPNATPRGLSYVRKTGVDLVTFDGEEALRRICQIHPSVRLLIRLLPPVVKCSFDFRKKFGCRLEDTPELLRKAKALGANVVGVCFHVGSLNTCATAFASAIRDARQVFEVAKSLGFQFRVLDIGGGFLGSAGTEHVFKKTARSIREALSTHFPTDDVRVIAEPGAYVVCSAVSLTTTIFSKRTLRDSTGTIVETCYFLNNGVYSSFAPGIEEYDIRPEPLLSAGDLLRSPRYPSTLFGQTLCPRDVLRRDAALPDMRVGESIVWKNMGAYSSSMCSKFCGFPLPDSRHVCRMDSRLKTKWIKDVDEIAKFVSKHTHIVFEEDLRVIDNFYRC